MSQNSRPVVAVLTNAPAPYRTPFFNELARTYRLVVCFETMRERGRVWDLDTAEFGFDWIESAAVSMPWVRTHSGFVEPRDLHLPLNLIAQLDRVRPDVVVSAELGVRTASAALYCRVRRRPLIAWWEGTPLTEQGRSGRRERLRRAVLRQCARAWCNGRASAESLLAYGVPEGVIDTGIIGIDTEVWRDRVDIERPRRAQIRDQLGLRGHVLLVCGALSPRKGVRELLAALELLTQVDDIPQWSLLVVGTGPEAGLVRQWQSVHPEIPVAMPGFVQPHELATMFSIADLFVMPSIEDCWGVVSLEARVAGVPQVTSSLVGAAADVIAANDVGSTVDPRDAHAFAAQLTERIRCGPRRVSETMRAEAVDNWAPRSCAERASASILAALESRKGISDVA